MAHPATSADIVNMLSTAQATARIERRRTNDEKEAFSSFRSTVADIDPNGSIRAGRTQANTPGETALIGGQAAPDSRLHAIRSGYESTVMSVPHYETEYNDTYPVSVAGELGPTVASALVQQTEFHTESKQRLLEMVAIAIDVRERFLSQLDRECDSLERAVETLPSILEEVNSLADERLQTAEFGALEAFRTRMTTLADQCESTAQRRQRVINSHETLHLDDIDLPTYLYQELSVSYPVLAGVGQLLNQLESLKRRVDREIAAF
jgi:hypothetical protein